MSTIENIRNLRKFIFLIPLIAINLCLFISQNPNFLENTIFTVDHSEYTSVILSKFLNTYGYKVNRIYISKTHFNFRIIKKNFWFY